VTSTGTQSGRTRAAVPLPEGASPSDVGPPARGADAMALAVVGDAAGPSGGRRRAAARAQHPTAEQPVDLSTATLKQIIKAANARERLKEEERQRQVGLAEVAPAICIP
jgi:hypothetical protein